jgi:hypothetical protein
MSSSNVTPYKVVARNTITGRQYKKWEYVTKEKYDKYGTDIIKRYNLYYDMEVYKMENAKWELIATYDRKE